MPGGVVPGREGRPHDEWGGRCASRGTPNLFWSSYSLRAFQLRRKQPSASPKATVNACSRVALVMDHGYAKHIAQQGELAQGLFGGFHVAVVAGARTS